MLKQGEVEELRRVLKAAKNPLFLFDDDPDGLCAFMLLYRYIGEGIGYPVKSAPMVTIEHLKVVREHEPDVIFVLDLNDVDQEFIDRAGVPVYWIDHHGMQDPVGCHYYNPMRYSKEYTCTTALCYQVTGQDLWIATIGTLWDYYWAPYLEEFKKSRPDLLPESVSTIREAVYDHPIGKIVRLFSFNLKGTSKQTTASVAACIKIQSLEELENKSSEAAQLLWSRYESINRDYNKIKTRAMATKAVEGVWVFTYDVDENSVTKDLANEIVHRFPSTIIVLGRLKDGSYRCSLRATVDIPLRTLLLRALEGINGKGGGHEQACGAKIDEEDFRVFLGKLRQELKEYRESK
jgi:single-stranded DNA-specific DHH superfamily exonuclease